MINVAIIDDHPIALRGLEAIFNARDSLRICASAHSARDLGDVGDGRTDPDVSLMDLYLHQDQPALTDITALSARCPVLVMSASGRPGDVLAAIRAGARGYITKQASEESFVTAIQAIADGGFYLSSSLAYIMQADLNTTSQPPRPTLTTREEQTLSYIARGLTHAQTATRMGISETTVNTHIERIRRKLGLGNKAELTRLAITIEQQHLHDQTRQTRD